MRPANRLLLTVLTCILSASVAGAQTFRTEDPVIRRMWQVGMQQSETEALARGRALSKLVTNIVDGAQSQW